MKKLKSKFNVVTFALLAGALAMFTNISKASIWHDEGYTMMLAPQSPGMILARTARDVHPPGHYLVLHYWMELFGASEVAARSLSAVFMLGTALVLYFIVKRLFGKKPAQLAVLLIALGPFVVRYGQEARMYAQVAFLLAMATLMMVKAVQDRKTSDYYLYGVFMAAALYTHYYAIFMIVVHWLYMLVQTLPEIKDSLKVRRGLFDPHWWGGNFLAAALFLPWVPAAYAQFSRVQAAFWIPAVGPHTLPGTIAQFLNFTDLGIIPLPFRVGALVLFGGLLLYLLWKNREERRGLWLLITYTAFAPVAVFILSFGRPIYVDRYFVFASAAFYALVAVVLYLKPFDMQKKLRSVVVVVLLAVFLVGIRNVYSQANHRMRDIGRIVSSDFGAGDEVVSGELYTYFDFSYYNKTGKTLRLLAPGGVSGYGESSLLYDRADEIVVESLSDVRSASGFVWLIGKTGDKDYFKNVPANWRPVGPKHEAKDAAAQKFQVVR